MSQEPTPNSTTAEPSLPTSNQDLMSPHPTESETNQAKPNSGSRKKMVIGLLIVMGLMLILTGAVGAYTLGVLSELKTQSDGLKVTAHEAYSQFKAQNLPAASSQVESLAGQVSTLEQTYQKLSFYRYVPIARSYYLDGEHGLLAAQAGIAAGQKTLAAVTPYADVLGFTGEGTFEGGTAENRVKLILETLEKVVPVLDEIGADLNTAQTELNQINEQRYPESFQGIPVRDYIFQAKAGLNAASTALTEYRPIIELLPDIAGSKGTRRKYLVLFQNDNELRPTGGFLTAYAVIFIENGVISPEKSDDIYALDQKFSKRIPIPEELGRYLTTEKYWNLRDMNTSPDFKVSMEQFFENYQSVRGEPTDIDGIIAVDTHLLTGLMKTVGPVTIPGYGTFSAEIDPRCDCPQIIYALSEIITKPTPYLREDRKGILAPLMQTLLQKIYASPRVFMADLFTVGLESVERKHLQAYFFNETFQQAVEDIHAAGRLEPEPDSDFLAVVNANLGGAKSNLFISSSVMQQISGPENGMITKTVEITYKNSRHGDNCNLEAGLLCLNATNRDWTRIYVPQGSELIDAQGFNQSAQVYDDLGFTVFEGFFLLEPNSQAKLKLTYKVPYTSTDSYRIKIWKQGGIDPVPHVIDVNGDQVEVLVGGDTNYHTAF